jgi:hypothetical protein
MEQLAYSSTAAFLAHYRMLTKAANDRGGVRPLSAREHEMLNDMHHLIEALTAPERDILLADLATDDERQASGEERRRRERAELKLRRLLLSQGAMRS